ncbi:MULTISPECIES: hypothetical protein [Streptomyces]|uniref:PE family protein n=2 Tax=Streptomyces TaxID=1883 RepID=A0A1I6T6C3_9ACTN|nr:MULTISPECIES: hypothetical protein [Streptomyces]MCK1816372.1 hypothetical protein [Streptomyces sp. XM4011]UWM50051.1 hypothetical protein N0X72_14090 [Streptomyces carpaticus]SFS84693.1 hypothetical protein SAMN05444716_104428 [Streptomyces harbinensis]
MAANISLDYAEIERVCGVLDDAVDNTLVPRMKEAKDEVDALLNTGLVLTATSPALEAKYETFTTNLIAGAEAIKEYANQFKEIKKSIENMDADMAEKINAG